MQKLFNKILVPVNFNRNTGWFIRKVAQIANRFDCDVHLLHTVSALNFIPFVPADYYPESFIQGAIDEATLKTSKVEQSLRGRLHEGLIVTTSVVIGSWMDAAKEAIIAERADLVVIANPKKWVGSALVQKININKLSLQTNCPVLTVTRQFNINHVENIVVPVHDFLPASKLLLANYIAKDRTAHIHLMSFEAVPFGNSGKPLQLGRAYRMMKEVGFDDIHCEINEGNDSAALAMEYARTVKADIILVNTGRENKLRGWWKKLRARYLCSESGIPVLTIAPGKIDRSFNHLKWKL